MGEGADQPILWIYSAVSESHSGASAPTLLGLGPGLSRGLSVPFLTWPSHLQTPTFCRVEFSRKVLVFLLYSEYSRLSSLQTVPGPVCPVPTVREETNCNDNRTGVALQGCHGGKQAAYTVP